VYDLVVGIEQRAGGIGHRVKLRIADFGFENWKLQTADLRCAICDVSFNIFLGI
jgi:hypothetical protein